MLFFGVTQSSHELPPIKRNKKNIFEVIKRLRDIEISVLEKSLKEKKSAAFQYYDPLRKVKLKKSKFIE